MPGCSRCGSLDPGRLYARLGPQRSLCSDCWAGEGRPFPAPSNLTVQEQHEHEEAIRRRMLARGGADRHVVRKGSS